MVYEMAHEIKNTIGSLRFTAANTLCQDTTIAVLNVI